MYFEVILNEIIRSVVYILPVTMLLCQLSKKMTFGFSLLKNCAPAFCFCPPPRLCCVCCTFLPPAASIPPNPNARDWNNRTERDTTRRLSLRRRLARARMTCPLFDTRRWVRDAEGLLRWAWERHEAGLPPAHCSSCLADAGQATEDGGGVRGRGESVV